MAVDASGNRSTSELRKVIIRKLTNNGQAKVLDIKLVSSITNSVIPFEEIIIEHKEHEPEGFVRKANTVYTTFLFQMDGYEITVKAPGFVIDEERVEVVSGKVRFSSINIPMDFTLEIPMKLANTDDDWDLTIQIDNSIETEFQLGMKAGATEGYDIGFDQDLSKDATVYLDDSERRFRIDFRAPSNIGEWVFKKDPNKEVTLNWIYSSLPGTNHLFLTRIDEDDSPILDEAIRMNQSGTITLEANGFTKYQIRYASHIDYDCDLHCGWNLLSFPFHSVETSAKKIFEIVKSQNLSTDCDMLVNGPQEEMLGPVWTWERGLFKTANQIDALSGYWINSNAIVTFPIKGIPIQSSDSTGGFRNVESGMERFWSLQKYDSWKFD